MFSVNSKKEGVENGAFNENEESYGAFKNTPLQHEAKKEGVDGTHAGDYKNKEEGESNKKKKKEEEKGEKGNEGEAPSIQDIEDEFEDDHSEPVEGCLAHVCRLQELLREHWQEHRKRYKIVFIIVALLLYAAYFVYAMTYRFGDEGSIRLLWMTCLISFGILCSLISKRFGPAIKKALTPLIEFVNRHSLHINTFFLTCILLAFVLVLIVDMTVYKASPYNLVSICGIFIYVFLCFVTSVNPSKIKWRTVAWGFGLQMALAMLVLKWQGGYMIFKWLGDRLYEYFEYINSSSYFLFGPNYMDHHIVMKLLPTVVFVSSTISVLFYLGTMQWFILKISKVMEVAMKTTAGESVSAASNIFVGQIEASIIIKPIIAKMTLSEVHAIMTGGFATIAGSVMAAYIVFGVPANHLISASVMSAPAALAISKISYPETKKSKTFVKDIHKILGKSPDSNIIEAASSGAIASIPLIASILVNLVAFISLLDFINATLIWFGARVGAPVPITFQVICSYILWPFAFVMGISLNDCGKVAELIGIKIFINEFVAFQQLSAMIKNRALLEKHLLVNGTFMHHGKDLLLFNSTSTNPFTLVNGIIENRSMVISTYALCGFSNFTSIGIQLGALCALVPNRKTAFSRLAIRTMITGNVACFVTACIAGLFYRDE